MACENNNKEYVFAYKGRTFVALVSPNIPTPISTLIDYDFMKKAGSKLTDIQCRKLNYGGHKMRSLMDTHCVAGNSMTKRIFKLDKRHREDGESNNRSDDDTNTSLDDEDEESSVTSDDEPDTSLVDDVSNATAQMCVAAQALASMVITSSSHP